MIYSSSVHIPEYLMKGRTTETNVKAITGKKNRWPEGAIFKFVSRNADREQKMKAKRIAAGKLGECHAGFYDFLADGWALKHLIERQMQVAKEFQGMK